MALTAEDIQNVSFSIDRKGYDIDEVDVFLEHVADEVGAMNEFIDNLQQALQEAHAEIQRLSEAAPEPVEAPAKASAEGEVDTSDLEARIADLEAQLAEKTANDSAISQALIVAQRSADDVLANARAEASSIIKGADEEADRIIGKAESDRMKIADAIRALEVDRSDVRAEYREMLSNFMADAQRKLAEIDGDSRRATVASQARSDANAAAYAPMGGLVVKPAVSEAPSFSAPSSPAPVSTPAPVTAPSASGFIDKDFSGYGAADADFSFDDID